MYERTEIADKYPGYPTGNEGFKTEIPLGCLKNGENEISIYAYESNDAAHNIATYKFDYVKDKIVISNVKVSDLTSSGYTVTCDVDAKAGISSVQFPTWSHVNGQDDLVWHQGTISGNKVSCRINVSEHKGDVNCVYQTDIYAYDKANHCETYRNQLLQYIDAVPPVISDVQITNVSENGYTISCVVNDKDSKIDRVQFPTWYGDDNPFQSDSSWRSSAKYSGKLENGRYVYRVNTSDYKNQIGKYTTHIYAWDERGNQSEGYAAEALIKKAHKHEYTSKVKKAATCTEDGIMLYTCKDNDDSYEKVIPATGHQNTELRNVKSATCASEGYTGDTYCKDCNTKLSTGKTIAKKNHNWDAGKITTKATCTKKGIKTYTCNNCNATQTEELPMTNHATKVTKFEKEASCESEGYTGDIYCQDCGALLEEGQVIPKLNHNWDAGKIIIKATTTSEGQKKFTCKRCNITRIEKIAKLPVQSIIGKTINDKSSNGVYKVLKNNCVEFIKPLSKKTSANIPDTVKINGKLYKVITISANAFKGITSLKTVTIGKNITSIKSKAFYGCRNLKSITIKTSSLRNRNVGAKAFTGTNAKPKVKVPVKQLKSYKKLLKSKGMSKKAIYKK